jgi:hypothetical protein
MAAELAPLGSSVFLFSSFLFLSILFRISSFVLRISLLVAHASPSHTFDSQPAEMVHCIHRRIALLENESMKRGCRAIIVAFLFFWVCSSSALALSFADYFPLTAASHGVKTFEWTYGTTGSYQSFISGSLAVPYMSGAIRGVGIYNMGDAGMLFAANDGTQVRWLAFTPEGGYAFVSTDCDLSAHPAAWTFSTITDGMVLDQGQVSFVYRDYNLCQTDNSQSLLFEIRDVTLLSGQFAQCIIIWYLDKAHSYMPLNFAGVDTRLGIALPTSARTGGIAVTGFDIFAKGIGNIASGDVDAATGSLAAFSELSSVDYSPAYGPMDLAAIAANWLSQMEAWRLDLWPDGDIDFHDLAILAGGWTAAPVE